MTEVMRQQPKTIRVSLLEGTIKGFREASITGRTLRAFALPRDGALARVKEQEAFAEEFRTGVYILEGSEVDNGKSAAYVGQGNYACRLTSHDSQTAGVGKKLVTNRAGLPRATLDLRTDLIHRGVLKEDGKHLEVTQDILAETANQLSVLVAGNMHGPRSSWLTEDGKTLAHYLDEATSVSEAG